MATRAKLNLIPVDDRQVALLDIILQPLLEDGEWASPRYIDQLADDNDIDFHAQLLGMPPGLLNPEEAGRIEPVCDRMGLTIAGAALCISATEIVADAIRAIRYVMERYDTFRVDKEGTAQPEVTSEQIAKELGFDELRSKQVGYLLAAEPAIGAYEPSDDGAWRASPRRDIRKLRGFADLKDYLQLRAGMTAWPIWIAPPQHPSAETAALNSVDEIDEGSGEVFDTVADLARIRGALSSDIPAALGSTKNVLETICKRILTLRGCEEPPEELPTLFRDTQKVLGIHAESMQGGRIAADEIKRISNACANITSGLGTLRNKYGNAHGQPEARILDDHTARFAILAGLAVAEYLLARFRELVDTERDLRTPAPVTNN